MLEMFFTRRFERTKFISMNSAAGNLIGYHYIIIFLIVLSLGLRRAIIKLCFTLSNFVVQKPSLLRIFA